MIQGIILAVILAGAIFIAVRYFARTLSGKEACCSDNRANCPMKDKGCQPDGDPSSITP
jgi:hypothetical protein